MPGSLKPNSASCHGVAKLGLVVDEGHQPQVGLDQQGTLQHQHTTGSAWQGPLLVGFLHSLDELSLEVFQLGNKQANKRNPPGCLPVASKCCCWCSVRGQHQSCSCQGGSCAVVNFTAWRLNLRDAGRGSFKPALLMPSLHEIERAELDGQ